MDVPLRVAAAGNPLDRRVVMRSGAGRHGLVLGLTVLVAAACGGAPEGTETETAPAAEAAAPDDAATPALTDAQIAAIVVTANAIDVANGELALARSENDRVRQFAQSMVGDHRAVNASAGELVERLGVTPEENDVSRSLQSDAEQTRARLSALEGVAFDRAYIENEVAYHRAVLDAMDGLLLPSATHPELRQALTDARPLFEAHLGHAETVQREVSGS